MSFPVAAETLAEMLPIEAASVMKHMSPEASAAVLHCMSHVAAALLLQQLDKDTLEGAVAGESTPPWVFLHPIIVVVVMSLHR